MNVQNGRDIFKCTFVMFHVTDLPRVDPERRFIPVHHVNLYSYPKLFGVRVNFF